MLGRVMTGEGGDLILATANEVLARRVPRSRGAHPLPHSRREGKAARPGHRRRQPAVHLNSGEASCSFINPTADFFVPDGAAPEAALARTTHLCISAHQDDIEIMAYHGIAECFGRKDRWFTGVVVTNGAGSPRSGIYGGYTDEEMQQVRLIEQRKAAYVGEYACQIQLGFTSSRSEEPEGDRRGRGIGDDPARRQARRSCTCTIPPTSTIRTSAWRCGPSPRCAPCARVQAEEGLRLRSLARSRLDARREQAGAAGVARDRTSPPRWSASSIRR